MDLPPLYKFLDVRGAMLTLGNRTFKHAKPSDFNDTEDLTIQSIYPESIEAALEKVTAGFADLILNHLDDSSTCASPQKEQLARIQHTFRTNPAAVDLVKSELAKQGASSIYDIEYMRRRSEEFIKEINDHLQLNRVLCVTTQIGSEDMWSDYAENHKAVALRIEPNIAKNSKFQLFRPVIYREKRPPLFEDSLDFMASILFGDQEEHRKATLDKIVYSKTLKWEHENEYRLVIPMRQHEQPWDTLPYHPEEITELYLGHSIDNTDLAKIVIRARAINPNIAIFRTKRLDDRILGFDPMK
jgi:Protein of unknown function (DUF2971)